MSYFNSSIQCIEQRCGKELSISFRNRPEVSTAYQVRCPHCENSQIYIPENTTELIPYTMNNAVQAVRI